MNSILLEFNIINFVMKSYMIQNFYNWMALILKLQTTYSNVAACTMNIHNAIFFKRIKLYVGYLLTWNQTLFWIQTANEWNFILTLYKTTYRVGLCLCAYQMSKVFKDNQITQKNSCFWITSTCALYNAVNLLKGQFNFPIKNNKTNDVVLKISSSDLISLANNYNLSISFPVESNISRRIIEPASYAEAKISPVDHSWVISKDDINRSHVPSLWEVIWQGEISQGDKHIVHIIKDRVTF